MGAKPVAKRSNIALRDRSKDVHAHHKRAEDGFMNHVVAGDDTRIYHSKPLYKYTYPNNRYKLVPFPLIYSIATFCWKSHVIYFLEF